MIIWIFHKQGRFVVKLGTRTSSSCEPMHRAGYQKEDRRDGCQQTYHHLRTYTGTNSHAQILPQPYEYIRTQTVYRHKQTCEHTQTHANICALMHIHINVWKACIVIAERRRPCNASASAAGRRKKGAQAARRGLTFRRCTEEGCVENYEQ